MEVGNFGFMANSFVHCESGGFGFGLGWLITMINCIRIDDLCIITREFKGLKKIHELGHPGSMSFELYNNY